MVDQEPTMMKIEGRQLKWYGHILRMSPDRTKRNMMYAKRLKKRRRGRPTNTWVGAHSRSRTTARKTLENMKSLAKDRKRWRQWLEKDSQNMKFDTWKGIRKNDEKDEKCQIIQFR